MKASTILSLIGVALATPAVPSNVARHDKGSSGGAGFEIVHAEDEFDLIEGGEHWSQEDKRDVARRNITTTSEPNGDSVMALFNGEAFTGDVSYAPYTDACIDLGGFFEQDTFVESIIITDSAVVCTFYAETDCFTPLGEVESISTTVLTGAAAFQCLY